MHENTRKSFYIFLSMVLGVLLFLMLQRAAFLVAFLVGVDVSSLSAQALSVVTTAIAVVFGAWYGIWLGLVWYVAIYEERTTSSLFGWIKRSSSSRRTASDDSWEIDDLVSLEKVTVGKSSPKLRFFEENTIRFGGANSQEEEPKRSVPVMAKAKTASKRAPRKSAPRKSVS